MFNSSWQCLEPAATCSVYIRRQVLRFRLAFYRAHTDTDSRSAKSAVAAGNSIKSGCNLYKPADIPVIGQLQAL